MTKLLFSKILRGWPHTFLANSSFRVNNVALLVPDYSVYYLALHVKLATPMRMSQIVEIFAYENPLGSEETSVNTVIVYQFHNLFTQKRLFMFAVSSTSSLTPPTSIAELFQTSTWLEREVSEMHGVCFGGKKDLRNLMLQYGDSSTPFRKSYPSIGTKEVVYDSVTDSLSQVPVSMQI